MASHTLPVVVPKWHLVRTEIWRQLSCEVIIRGARCVCTGQDKRHLLLLLHFLQGSMLRHGYFTPRAHKLSQLCTRPSLSLPRQHSVATPSFRYHQTMARPGIPFYQRPNRKPLPLHAFTSCTILSFTSNFIPVLSYNSHVNLLIIPP